MPLFIQTITFFLVIPKGMTQNIQNALDDDKQGHTDMKQWKLLDGNNVCINLYEIIEI